MTISNVYSLTQIWTEVTLAHELNQAHNTWRKNSHQTILHTLRYIKGVVTNLHGDSYFHSVCLYQFVLIKLLYLTLKTTSDIMRLLFYETFLPLSLK